MKQHNWLQHRIITLMLLILVRSTPLYAQDSLSNKPSENSYDAVLFPNVTVSAALSESGAIVYLVLAQANEVIEAELHKQGGGFEPLIQLKNRNGQVLMEGQSNIYGTGATLSPYTIEQSDWYFLVITYNENLSQDKTGTFMLTMSGTTPAIFSTIIPADPPQVADGIVLLTSQETLSEISGETIYYIPLQSNAPLTLFYDNTQATVSVFDSFGVPLLTTNDNQIVVDAPQWVTINVQPMGLTTELSIRNEGLATRQNLTESKLDELATPAPSPTFTLTLTPSATFTATLTLTPSETPTATHTLTPSMTPRISPTPSTTPTFTPSFTPTPTATLTPSSTPAITNTTVPLTIRLNDSQTEVSSHVTEQRYLFNGQSGDVVDISVESRDFDPKVLLLFKNDIIAENDDLSNTNTNALISGYKISANGEYTIVVSAYDGRVFSGTYTVSVEESYAPPKLITCPGTQQSQLYAGDIAQVSPEGVANRVRSGPSTNNRHIGSIPEASIITVLEGPVCGDGYAWYLVNYEGLEGWTAEGDKTTYWLEYALGERSTNVYTMLLNNGRGMTDGGLVNYGNFQVEGYCQRQGYRTTNDGREWYCTNNGRNVETINQEAFTTICRETYNRNDAYARRIGRGIRAAFRWRCVADVPLR